MSAALEELITVVVVTRNRESRIRQTIDALRRSDYSNFEVVVVDQSDSDNTAKALDVISGAPGITYIKMEGRGLSAGRNLGIEYSAAEIIALTDDDCAVDENWLAEIAAAFDIDLRIGVVFTNVSAGPHDRSSGFIPAYVRERPFLARSMREKHRVEGIGASMAIKRAVWRDLHGFDRYLGPGAAFRAADDLDFVTRSLQAGYLVYETPRANVMHVGFRTWSEGRFLIEGYLFGIGAMYAKQLKSSRFSALLPLWYLFWRWLLRGPVVDLGHTPPRMLRMRAFLHGFVIGLRWTVDRRRCHYVQPREKRARGLPESERSGTR